MQLSPEEKVAYPYLFKKADSSSLGVLTGENAVGFFEHSHLAPHILGEIWQLADKENNGFLTDEAFNLACRLIGHAQGGTKPSAAVAEKPGPLPKFDKYSVPGLKAASPAPSTPSFSQSSVVPQKTGTPDISAEDRARYAKLFASSGPVMGLLDGDKARDVLMKSRLPVDKLGQIWNLSDTRARGALDQTDFAIAMYLVQSLMSGNITTLPATLPPGLREQLSTGIPTPPPVSPTSFSQPGRQPTINSQPLWDVSASEKANSDKYFDTLDKSGRGFIEGDVAVPFFQNSTLPDTILAAIWDLSDVKQEGKLWRDTFAVAMKLISDKLAGKDLPTSLPISLVPPSMRDGATAGIPTPSAPPKPSAHQDLLSLLDDGPTEQREPPAVLSPQHTAKSVAALSPQHTARSTTALSPQHTASSGPRAFSGPTPARSPLSHATSKPQDLFSDDAQPTASGVGDESSRLGNLTNQLASTQRSLDQITGQRSQAEAAKASVTAQIQDLETKLSHARVAHDAESKLLVELQTKHQDQTQTLAKLKDEVITAESTLSALKVERAEIEGSFLRDKEDIREMKRRMQEVRDETASLQTELERLKKDARQQKGLSSIARKQLSLAESDKEKVIEELETTSRSASQVAEEPPVAEDPPAAPLSEAPSPNIDSAPKSTNPFDRLGSTPQVISPVPTGENPQGAAQSDNEPSQKVETFQSSAPNPFGIPSFGSVEPLSESSHAPLDFDAAFQDFGDAPAVEHTPVTKGFDDEFGASSDWTGSALQTEPTLPTEKEADKVEHDDHRDGGDLPPIQEFEPVESESESESEDGDIFSSPKLNGDSALPTPLDDAKTEEEHSTPTPNNEQSLPSYSGPDLGESSISNGVLKQEPAKENTKSASADWDQFDELLGDAPSTLVKRGSETKKPSLSFDESFDSAFAGFESGQASSSAPANGAASSFDDSFTNAAAPATTQEDFKDSPDVERLKQMGFHRDSVVAALEKHNYRPDRALNELLKNAK